jgi:predicted alpha/beta hydrolase family esterase
MSDNDSDSEIVKDFLVESYENLDRLDRDLVGHSLGCAMVCRKFSEKLAAADSEKAYMAGLLHDIGFMVNCLAFPKEFAKTMESASLEGIPLVEADNRARWRLCEYVLRQDDPRQSTRCGADRRPGTASLNDQTLSIASRERHPPATKDRVALLELVWLG